MYTVGTKTDCFVKSLLVAFWQLWIRTVEKRVTNWSLYGNFESTGWHLGNCTTFTKWSSSPNYLLMGVWFTGKPSFWCEHGHRKAGTCEYGRYCLHTVQTKSILNQKLQSPNDWRALTCKTTIKIKQISLCGIFFTVTHNLIRLFVNLSIF